MVKFKGKLNCTSLRLGADITTVCENQRSYPRFSELLKDPSIYGQGPLDQGKRF